MLLSPSVTPLRPKLPSFIPAIPPTSDTIISTSTVHAPPNPTALPTTAIPGPNIALDMFAILQEFKSSMSSLALEVDSMKRAASAPLLPLSPNTPPPPAVTAPAPSLPPAVQPAKPAPVTVQTLPLEFAMARPWPTDEHMRLGEATKVFIGNDLVNLASQAATAGVASPIFPPHLTTPDGFRKLKDITAKQRSLQQYRIDNGETVATTLAAASPHPLIAAISRAPSASWKKDQLVEYLISALSQSLSAIIHSNPDFAIPGLLQVIHVLKVVELDQALGQTSWTYLVPIFDQLAKDSVHRPSIWTTPLLSYIQEARLAYHNAAKSSLHPTKEPRPASSPPPHHSTHPAMDRNPSPPPRRHVERSNNRALSDSHRPFCANWNSDRSCASPNCSFAHVCSSCKSSSHRFSQCRNGPARALPPARR